MEELNFDSLFEEDTTPIEDSNPTETVEATEVTEDTSTGSETEPTEQSETEPPAAPQAAETIEFKRNRDVFALDKTAVDSIAQALGLDSNAVVATLQKGYDYDRKTEQLTELEAKLDGYGKSLNMDRDGLFGLLQDAGDRAALRAITAQIRAEHPDWGDDAINEIGKARLGEQRRTIAERNAASEKQKQDEAARPLVEFFMRHTDITPDTMSEEMKADIFERGFSPEEAYLKHQNTQKDKEIESIKAELAKLQKAAENKAKAIGSVTSEVASKPVDDDMADFLFAFE